MSDLELPLPPLFEQTRIAAILGQQMKTVEKARAAIQAQLEAARSFLSERLRAIFESHEAQQWPKKKLGHILTLRKEIVHPRDNPTGPATFVGLEHIESVSGRRVGSLSVEMSLLTGRKPRFYEGDIVYGYLRPYLNKVWIAEFDGLCSVDQYAYSVKSGEADNRFVAWFMRSATFLNRAPVDRAPGWLPRIRIEELAATDINLPALEDQRRIVKRLDEEMSTIEIMQKALEEQQKAVSELPATILRRAFNGEL